MELTITETTEANGRTMHTFSCGLFTARVRKIAKGRYDLTVDEYSGFAAIRCTSVAHARRVIESHAVRGVPPLGHATYGMWFLIEEIAPSVAVVWAE
jgi:hypothetical protein